MDNRFCKNHPNKKALSHCHNCGDYLCEDCLIGGLTYYYCKKPDCYSFIEKEIKVYEKYYASNPHFCEKCIKETIGESTGDLETFNLIGSAIHVLGGLCPTCRSVIVEKRYVFLGLPIKSKGYFRAIKLSDKYGIISSSKTFISRKLKDQNISLFSITKHIRNIFLGR